ncbi:MAG: MFS transporter [Fuerstiella sp.]|nr:MFS transporter [Fuerstiella sp.]
MTPTRSQFHSDSPTSVRWFVLGIVSFAAASAYLTRYCISAANTTIQQDLEFSDSQMGELMSVFAVGYLLCQVPGGWLGNRFGTRFAFAFLSVCWSFSNVWSAMASAFQMQWASRFSLGLFQAGLTPISARILKDWIPLQWRGRSSSWITASMSVGGAFTMVLTGWLLGQGYGWRAIFSVYSLVGVAWAVGFYWYFRTFPQDHRSVNQAELTLIRKSDRSADGTTELREYQPIQEDVVTQHETSHHVLMLNMLKCPGMWGLCVQSFFRAAGYVFFVTWFFAFLEYVYDIDKAEAGLLNSLPLIAVVVGSIAGGIIVDWLFQVSGSKWISRSGTAIVSLSVCGFLTMASAWTSSATELSVVIAIGALFSGIGSPAAWTATIDIGGRHTAVVMAVMNMAGCLAGVLLPLLLGNWFEQIRETDGNWNLVIYLHAVFYFSGALSWILVNPLRTIEDGHAV